MFLNQLQKSPAKIKKYLIFCGIFILTMATNFFSSDTPAADTLQNSIKNVGELGTFLSLLIPFAILLFMLLAWVRLAHRQSITSLITSRQKVDWHRIFFAFFIWTLAMILSTAINYILAPENFQFQFDFAQFSALFFIAIIFIPIQTCFEELLFRGYMMQGTFMLFGKKIIALILPSILFGLMHLSNPEVSTIGIQMMVFYIGSGLFFALITLYDQGTELAIGCHTANNLIGCLLITSADSVFQTPSIFKYQSSTTLWDIYFHTFVILPILFVIFSKKFKFKTSLSPII